MPQQLLNNFGIFAIGVQECSKRVAEGVKLTSLHDAGMVRRGYGNSLRIATIPSGVRTAGVFVALAALTNAGNWISVCPFPSNRVGIESAHDVADLGPASWCKRDARLRLQPQKEFNQNVTSPGSSQ